MRARTRVPTPLTPTHARAHCNTQWLVGRLVSWLAGCFVGWLDARTVQRLSGYDPRNQLEYLEDMFGILALKIRASAARIKEDMKQAGGLAGGRFRGRAGEGGVEGGG